MCVCLCGRPSLQEPSQALTRPSNAEEVVVADDPERLAERGQVVDDGVEVLVGGEETGANANGARVLAQVVVVGHLVGEADRADGALQRAQAAECVVDHETALGDDLSQQVSVLREGGHLVHHLNDRLEQRLVLVNVLLGVGDQRKEALDDATLAHGALQPLRQLLLLLRPELLREDQLQLLLHQLPLEEVAVDELEALVLTRIVLPGNVRQ